MTMGSAAPVRFYRCIDPDWMGSPPNGSHTAHVQLWRPGDRAPQLDSFSGPTRMAYQAFHRLRIFANRDYCALYLKDDTGRALHVSFIFPRFFRFPFMAPDDLQIGATHTDSDARGQGLAQRGLIEAVHRLAQPGRAFWYLTETTNEASCAVAEKAGFGLAGCGARVPRLGIQALSAYRLTQPETNAS